MDEPRDLHDATTEHAAHAVVKVCAQCGSRFSGDARFCPFDAEPLSVATGAVARDPLLGTVVDQRYEIETVLGEGGMGTVYRARHRILDKRLAVKVLRTDLARDVDLGLRFLREAKAAASVSHPSVVQITDFGTLPSGQPYFVMELLSGASLSNVLRKGGPLPAARAVRLLTQMVDALSAAHRAGVVHRDLKPDNVLVCPTHTSEIAKVLDFGLAKVAGQSRLTKAGVVFGTPHYMSPEQASGGVVDERTDIYALGVVMYEMFTGRVPFEADTYMGVLTKHLYVAPTPPSVHLGGIAELGALEQVTLRCLEKKQEKRYASMQALGEELTRVASFSDAGALTLEPAELREPRGPRLADELELPTAAELRHALGERSRDRSVVRWAFPILSLLAVAVLGTVYSASRRSTGHVDSGPAASSPTPQSGIVAPAGVPVPAPEPRVSASAPSGPLVAPVPEEPPTSIRPRASGGRKRPRTDPPRPVDPQANPPAANRKIPGGEIIDPWSK